MAREWLQRVSPTLRIVGSMRHERGWVEPSRVIYDHELVIFERGRFRVEIEGTEVELEAGTYLIVPPGVWHVTREYESRSWLRRWVHFDWEFLPHEKDCPVFTVYPASPATRFMRHTPEWVPSGTIRGTIPDLSRAVELHKRLEYRWNNGTRHDRLLCRALLTELLLEILDEGERENPGEESLQLALQARRILERLAAEPAGDSPPIRKELEKTGCSYAHACRVFRKSYGLTPVAYVNSLRIERAKLLLQDTNMNISEVSTQLGFSSLSYFSRLFSSFEKITPLDYLNRNR